MITALTFLFKARDLSEKTFKAHFHVVPRAHHKLHLSASFIFKRKGPLCVEMGFTLGSAIKNLGLFSKSPGDFRIEKMDFYSSLGSSTPGVLLPRLL